MRGHPWRDLLHDLEHLAAPRHAVAPDAVEIGDKRLDHVRTNQRLGLCNIGELVKRVVDRRVGAAPAAPAPQRRESLDRPREVVGRVPMIEGSPSATSCTSARTTR